MSDPMCWIDPLERNVTEKGVIFIKKPKKTCLMVKDGEVLLMRASFCQAGKSTSFCEQRKGDDCRTGKNIMLLIRLAVILILIQTLVRNTCCCS